MASRALRKRPHLSEAARLAAALLPEIQANRGGFKTVDVANHSDEDQRHMVRSGEKRTIRRKTHIEKLKASLDLDDAEAAACQWYADAHQLRYDTLGITARYGDRGRGNSLGFDHLPASAEQDQAASELSYAREGISAPLRLMFDRIVIHEWPITPSIEWLFRLATRQLLNRIEGMVSL